MEKWEIALNKFLQKWKNRKEVIGAIVCGSYITGNPTKHSDIDIHIILDHKTSWRERGNEIIDGFLIEYFANPVPKIKSYFEEDYNNRRKVAAHMFYTGKVLFDKTGDLKKLIKISKNYLKKKYPKQNKTSVELAKYHLWDEYDNLEEIFEANAKEFFFVFYNNLNELFDTYAKFLQFDSVPVHKLRRFLTNESDKRKYKVKDFPDEKFVKMWVNALNIKTKSKMTEAYQKLTAHVLDKMGGFNINGWKIKSLV